MSRGTSAILGRWHGIAVAASLVAIGIPGPSAWAEPIPSEAEAHAPVPIRRPAETVTPPLGDEPPPAGGEAKDRNSAGQRFRALLEREARKHDLPPDIADAVAAIESGYDPSAVGSVGEIGLMQVLPSTAAMLGFSGDRTELAKPEVNIRYGVAYLATAWRRADGDLCRALMKYRAGHGEEVMTPLSVRYCGRARAHLAAIGSPFAERISVPLASAPVGPSRGAARRGRGTRVGMPATSAAFWAMHEARVRAITARVHAKWRRLASR